MADLVTSEFFEQGDIERQELNITPIVSNFWASRLTVFLLSFRMKYQFFFLLETWLVNSFSSNQGSKELNPPRRVGGSAQSNIFLCLMYKTVLLKHYRFVRYTYSTYSTKKANLLQIFFYPISPFEHSTHVKVTIWGNCLCLIGTFSTSVQL